MAISRSLFFFFSEHEHEQNEQLVDDRQGK